MKIVIVIVLVVLLLAGGAAAFFFLQEEAATDGGQTVEKTEEQPKITAEPVYLDIKNLTIPIIRNRAIQKYVLFRVTLEMSDEDAKNDVKAMLPTLQDALIMDLNDYYAYQTPGEDGIDVKAVRRRLQRASDRAVGKGKVRNILIQGAFERAGGK